MTDPDQNHFPDEEKFEDFGVMHRRVYQSLGVSSLIGMIVLMATWAITEYINKDGWPNGVTLGSGGPGVWNLWIIYPVIVWIGLISLQAQFSHLTRAITKQERIWVKERVTKPENPHPAQ